MNVYNYIQYDMKSVTQTELKIKIVIIGDIGTGKSNITTRFCRGTFTEYSNPTVGIQLSSRKLWAPFHEKQQIYKLCFWDMTSDLQQSYKASFFKNALGIIYVYDATKEESLDNLSHWREMALKYVNNQNFTEMLLANKIDLVNFKEVSSERGQKWAIKNPLLNLRIQQSVNRFTMAIIKKFDDSVQPPIKLVREETTHRGCCR